MRPFYLLLLSLLPVFSFAQTDTLITWPNGETKHEGSYSAEGLKVGTHSYYWRNGAKQAVVVYSEEGKPLTCKTWNEKGGLMDDFEFQPSRFSRSGDDSTIFINLRAKEMETVGDIEVLWLSRSEAGELPEKGDKVWIHYSGFLDSGRKFDSSLGRGRPLSFRMGKGEVIPGMEEAVKMMRPGDQMIVRIPPEMGYQYFALEDIPPHSTLIFKIERVEMK